MPFHLLKTLQNWTEGEDVTDKCTPEIFAGNISSYIWSRWINLVVLIMVLGEILTHLLVYRIRRCWTCHTLQNYHVVIPENIKMISSTFLLKCFCELHFILSFSTSEVSFGEKHPERGNSRMGQASATQKRLSAKTNSCRELTSHPRLHYHPWWEESL